MMEGGGLFIPDDGKEKAEAAKIPFGSYVVFRKRKCGECNGEGSTPTEVAEYERICGVCGGKGYFLDPVAQEASESQRDRLARTAMHAELGNQGREHTPFVHRPDFPQYAERWYRLADAMIKESKK